MKMKKLYKIPNALIFLICCFGFSITLEGVTAKKCVSLKETVLNKYVFTNASKHWNHYVRKLVYSSAVQTFLNAFARKESSVIVTI